MNSNFSIIVNNVNIAKGIRCLFVLMLFILSHFSAHAQIPKLKWVDDIKSSGVDCNVYQMVVDKQNNIYITGVFGGTVDFDPSSGVKNLVSTGTSDVFVAKYKQDGTLVWADPLLGNNDPYDFANGLAVDKDGNVTVTGFFEADSLDADPGPGVHNLYNPAFTAGNTLANEMFVIHLDTNGGFLWANSFAGIGFQVAADSQDDAISTSSFEGTTVTIGDSTYTSNSNGNVMLIKYGPAGNVIWSAYINTQAGSSLFGNAAVSIDTQDNIVLTGDFESTVNFNPLGVANNLTEAIDGNGHFIAKYSTSGILTWVDPIIGPRGNFSIYTSPPLCTDLQNNIYYGTTFTQPYAFGDSTVTNTTGMSSVCIAKYSPAGVVQFARATKGTSASSSVAVFSIVSDANSNIYTTGFLSDTVNFNLNAGTPHILGGGGFIVKYDQNGNYIYGFNPGGPQGVGGNAIAVDTNGNVDIASSFEGTANFTSDSCSTDTLTAPYYDTYDGFIAQYGADNANIITPPPVTTFCSATTPGEITGSLPTGSGTYTYQWQNSTDSVTFANISGATDTNYTPPQLSATTYYRRIVSSTGSCSIPSISNVVTITIKILPVLTAPVVTAITSTQSSVTFSWAAIPGATGYQVSTDGGLTYAPPSSGPVGLTDTVGGLQAGQSVTILVQAIGVLPCQLSPASAAVTGTAISATDDVIYVPNALTPNGDGRNDQVHVHGANIKSIQFNIYDQWGELVFTSTSPQNGWDGTYKGSKEPVGPYTYFLQAVMNDGQKLQRQGTITIIR